MKRWLWVLSLPILMLLACSSSGNRDNYYPLAVGNEWNYRLYDVLQSDSAPTETVDVGSVRYSVLARETLSTGVQVLNCLRVLRYLPADTSAEARARGDTAFDVEYRQYMCVTPRAVLVYRSKLGTTVDTLLVYPATANRLWTRVTDPSVRIMVRYLRLEDVTVPAGTYRQAWLTRDSILPTGQTGYQWYAPRIGLVRSEYGYRPVRRPKVRATQVAELVSAVIR